MPAEHERKTTWKVLKRKGCKPYQMEPETVVGLIVANSMSAVFVSVFKHTTIFYVAIDEMRAVSVRVQKA